jgi:hypothetical protein
MGSVKIHVEGNHSCFWTYIHRSAGELPETPLYIILRWILEQLNFGNFETERDSGRGDIVSLTLGKMAAPQPVTDDEVADEAGHRLLAVNLAGIMAQCRESGIPPAGAQLSKMVAQQSTEWGRRNTEFHYAFELIKVLARLNKKTFNLESPPIGGLAPDSVVSYLRESTRCWLYGFHGACVALSRACLEDALKVRLPVNRGLPESRETLISSARRRNVLDDQMVELAHIVRQTGNKFLHGKPITETDSRGSLDAVRGVVEHIFTS